jgi:hypothetical protein
MLIILIIGLLYFFVIEGIFIGPGLLWLAFSIFLLYAIYKLVRHLLLEHRFLGELERMFPLPIKGETEAWIHDHIDPSERGMTNINKTFESAKRDLRLADSLHYVYSFEGEMGSWFGVFHYYDEGIKIRVSREGSSYIPDIERAYGSD